MVKPNTPSNPTEHYNAVRAAFTAKGTSLHRWCKDNGVHHQNARKALLATWRGPKAAALVQKITIASGMDG